MKSALGALYIRQAVLACLDGYMASGVSWAKLQQSLMKADSILHQCHGQTFQKRPGTKGRSSEGALNRNDLCLMNIHK